MPTYKGLFSHSSERIQAQAAHFVSGNPGIDSQDD
jgi:hypothetical protein